MPQFFHKPHLNRNKVPISARKEKSPLEIRGASGEKICPLELLSTQASRTLHAMLQECLSVARELDQERGWVDSDGEEIGWAETIGALELGMRREVFGARGGGRE
ncbi:hypothetical protein [Armatimonas sp.]|uniref:hypothetical protein n=1 Tax=Armatimonas sp. TaxID=1872638 RepID=UPI00374CE5BC